MSRRIFINRVYWPNEQATAQLLTDLAEGLAAAGENVIVVTSGAASLPARETRHGVTIERLCRDTGRKPHALLGRARDHAKFLFRVHRFLTRNLQPGDTVVALTDPPLLGVIVARGAQKHDAACWHWVQDIYPETAIELTGFRTLRAFVPLRNRAWRRSQGCVAVSQGMRQHLLKHGVSEKQITVCANWAPLGLETANESETDALRDRWGTRDKFVVAYSGNLGRAHELSVILDVAERLRDDPRIVFIFLGNGAQRTTLQERVGRQHLENVRFLPAQARENLAATLAAADLHFVTIRGCCEGLVFPSKLYGIAAVGRPVLAVGAHGSELRTLVESASFGFGFGPEEADRIVSTVKRLANAPHEMTQLVAAARRFHSATGGAEHAIKVWQRAFSAVPASSGIAAS